MPLISTRSPLARKVARGSNADLNITAPESGRETLSLCLRMTMQQPVATSKMKVHCTTMKLHWMGKSLTHQFDRSRFLNHDLVGTLRGAVVAMFWGRYESQ
jgi:hypothetical protein